MTSARGSQNKSRQSWSGNLAAVAVSARRGALGEEGDEKSSSRFAWRKIRQLELWLCRFGDTLSGAGQTASKIWGDVSLRSSALIGVEVADEDWAGIRIQVLGRAHRSTGAGERASRSQRTRESESGAIGPETTSSSIPRIAPTIETTSRTWADPP